jgi:hypothetical protein
VRHSTLPVQEIADAVNSQTSVNAWVDWNGNPGAYLCEYIAYLGMWYQDIYNDTGDPYRCLKAGFIHVKSSVNLQDAMEATNITIREVIKSMVDYPPDIPIINGPTRGEPGVEYSFCIVASDPDEDSLYVKWDWGDGTFSDWLGPYPSGTEVCDNHSWSTHGTFTISVTVRDEHGNTITANQEIIIPRNKVIQRPFLNILQNNPNIFPILQQLFLRLGLQ